MLSEVCERCGLYAGCKSPFMPGSGPRDPLVLVVGEAPGEYEDERGVPFVGKSGQLLRETLEDAGLDVKEDVRFTNVVRCRPPDNKISNKYINHCKGFTLEEIEEMKPDLVLLLGNSPLYAILGEKGITTWNGVIVNRKGVTYVPLFHPAYILRNAEALPEWVNGLDTAVATLTTETEDDAFNRILVTDAVKLRTMMIDMELHDVIAYDTETSSLDAFEQDGTVPCVSLAAGNTTYAVPVHHKENWMNEKVLTQFLEWLADLLTDPEKFIIGHNIKYDQVWSRNVLDIDFDADGDTMIVSHMLDSRKGIHSLKRLAGLHLGMYDYDTPLYAYTKEHPEADPRRGGSYAHVPLRLLLMYAALDTEATLKLWRLLFPKLSERQQAFYTEVVMPASNTLADMEFNGNKVDDYIAERYCTIYRYVQSELYEKIIQDKRVQRTVSHFQTEADQKIIASLPEDTFKTRMTKDYIQYETPKRKGKRKRALIEFNPNSSFQVGYLYFNKLRLKVAEHTEAGKMSTRADLVKPFAEEHPIVGDIIYYKLLTKMLGTYLEPAHDGSWKSGDGRVRSSYNLHGTRTGRLSSSNPNMQNIPTPEKEPGTLLAKLPIKNIFTHSWGEGKGVLMSVDYSGMELRIFASLARCLPMLHIHKIGGDFHSMVAIMATTGRKVTSISPEESYDYKNNYKAERYKYKWTNWTLLYGGDRYTLVRLYGIPEHEAAETEESYYRTFPEVLRFREEAIEFAEFNGYIQSPFGRREYLAYINDGSNPSKRNQDRRAAVNMPVQSAASDILLCALSIIRDKMIGDGYRAKLVNTVHDSIVFDVPLDEVESLAALCVDVMENIVDYQPVFFPNVDFSWLLSPLKADVEVGTHYGTEMGLSTWREKYGL